MKDHPSQDRLNRAIRDGNAAFWSQIRLHYPEAKLGAGLLGEEAALAGKGGIQSLWGGSKGGIGTINDYPGGPPY